MERVTTLFEQVALTLRPVGLLLGGLAALLYVASFASLFGMWRFTPAVEWGIVLGLLWSGGLAAFVAWFKPNGSMPTDSAAQMPIWQFPVVPGVSNARRFGKTRQALITGFFGVFFISIFFMTLIALKEVG